MVLMQPGYPRRKAFQYMSVVSKEGNLLTQFCDSLKNDAMAEFIRWLRVEVSQICYVTLGKGLEAIVTDRYEGVGGRV